MEDDQRDVSTELVSSWDKRPSDSPTLVREDAKAARLKRMRENIRDAVALAGIIIAIITIAFNTQALQATRQSLDETRTQIEQGKYQSVYQQQIALWTLATKDPQTSNAILGGTPSDAAEAAARDFYAYVYAQLAPLNSNGERAGLALAGNPVRKPVDVDPGEWDGWISWSYTIAIGLRTAPNLCSRILNSGDYTRDFQSAVGNARLPSDLNDPNSPLVPVCIV